MRRRARLLGPVRMPTSSATALQVAMARPATVRRVAVTRMTAMAGMVALAALVALGRRVAPEAQAPEACIRFSRRRCWPFSAANSLAWVRYMPFAVALVAVVAV